MIPIIQTINPNPCYINQVFLTRKKIGSYRSIPSEIKKELNELFIKSPYPNREDLQSLGIKLSFPLIRIQNWFKYHRKKDFQQHKGKKIIQNYKKKHKFDEIQSVILESHFRSNPTLEYSTMVTLRKTLNCHDRFIKRWFYYRNQKLTKIKNIKSSLAAQTVPSINPNNNFDTNPLTNVVENTIPNVVENDDTDTFSNAITNNITNANKSIMKIEETIKTEQIYDNSNSFTGNLLNTVSPYQNFNNFTRNMENIRNTQAQIQGAQINRFYLNQIYMQNIQNMNYFSNMMSRRITPPVIIWNNFNNYPQINTIPMKFEHIVPKDEFKSE